MNAVGKLGSYISRGVYTVSAPFHPFGGAVDIIVVQQPDGSFKSSPWYVRFGKFQGVLKTKEKIVTIRVNGVEAGLQMYLDHKGEAFFIKESENEEGDRAISPPSPGDEMDVWLRNAQLRKIRSCNYDGSMRNSFASNGAENGMVLNKTTSQKSMVLGNMFCQKSMRKSEQGSVFNRVNSLERAEIAANLLEVKWLTNLSANDLRPDGSPKKPTEKKIDSPIKQTGKQDGTWQISPTCDESDKLAKLDSHYERNGDTFETSTIMESQFEDTTLCGSLILRRDEVVVETSTLVSMENTSRSCVDQLSRELVNNSTSGDLGIGLIKDDYKLVRSSGRNMVTGEHHKERIANTQRSSASYEDLGIYTTENDGLADRGEVTSYSVDVESSRFSVSPEVSTLLGSMSDAQSPHSIAISNGTSQALEEACKALPVGVFGVENGDQKVTSRKTLNSCPAKSDIPPKHDSTAVFLSTGADDRLKQYSQAQDEMSAACHDKKSVLATSVVVSSASETAHNESISNAAFANGDVSPEFSPPNTCLVSSDSIIISRDVVVSKDPNQEMDSNTLSNIFISNHQEKGKLLDSSSHVPIILSEEAGHSDNESKTHCVGDCSRSLGKFDQLHIADKLNEETRMEISFHSDMQTNPVLTFNYVEKDKLLQINDEVNLEGLATEGNDDKIAEVLSNTSQTSPILIPRSEISHEHTQVSARSLPAIHFGIQDGQQYHHPCLFSCSPNLSSVKNDADLPKKVASGTSNIEAGSEIKVKQESCTYEPVLAAFDTKNGCKSRDGRAHPAVELSLRNMTCEEMREDATSPAFVSNKQQIIKPEVIISNEHFKKNHKDDACADTIPSGGNWKLWPFGFKRSKTINILQPTHESINQAKLEVDSIRKKCLERDDDMQKPKNLKNKIRLLVPSSEEVAFLNLKEGANEVTFSFSTAMFGRQQVKFQMGLVDARIYLWRWNTQIVISDVDGTITRSDVLGQFMPLVGIDWSQTGVAHLFSAIKENGYQLLFLSARAISQAYLTRQFLFNLKQDGKALPDGPVVISPDGLFPSLFREVIRKAPHEFKISCLEAIRALFPPDCSPFYAGFGNRDTDEISYIKVGIPRGKIFIINPKGEVVVNRRVDMKSYASLHALVNGMFPTMSSREQEDFNSWNYWKLPLPEIAI